jgi:hypothetical protein
LTNLAFFDFVGASASARPTTWRPAPSAVRLVIVSLVGLVDSE